ncbi:hypothetical protein EHI8A_061890 [Entamoeba histolytica HM-1:IMSS-B]|uniref:Uncharacterized protein n=6 Tax=Entamoeba histolytica TaxID=5759 RepID=C4M3A9_ENTH1|nr:hypothetical protein EHI_175420 [Entamoeba histolytica HM-1:IMSS]EMD45110.1 Hypothetical protein EHI5A_090350 [Entamoeba histolytica KU27]EMH75951.1 hypothetical protein EHI8A_061890 [Entamoeba histolytica HM-1:IMSS-B]EMS15226.1 hypothetical protein KM1_051490 [Entamoeba histolytica HM-3:IMSS]ENY64032.1 hypothetical protein EHI7A_103880 [Entamoeba histolytica HM-1:IMSS-A]GAT95792.1 hypothetical protein CL6EHI_175420 [Entamoeba histolytica]|eukprot:XP_650612.1 hypothetical protein EHI_175420 [Entamoeba histolytica HM-1:IMSS]
MASIESQLYEVIRKAIPKLPKEEPPYNELVQLLYNNDNGEMLPQTVILCELLMILSGAQYVGTERPNQVLTISPHSLHITSLPATSHFKETVPLIIAEYHRILSASSSLEQIIPTLDKITLKSLLLESLLNTIIFITCDYCLPELLSLVAECITNDSMNSLIEKSTNCEPLQTLFSALSYQPQVMPSVRYTAARKFLFPNSYKFISFMMFKENPCTIQLELNRLIESSDVNGVIALLRFCGKYSKLSHKPLIDDSHCLLLFRKGLSQGILDLCIASIYALSGLKFGYSSLVSLGLSCSQNKSTQMLLPFYRFKSQYLLLLKIYIDSVQSFDKNPLLPIISVMQQDFLLLFKQEICCAEDLDVLFNAVEYFNFSPVELTTPIATFVFSHPNYYYNNPKPLIRILKYITFDQKCPPFLIGPLKKNILPIESVEMIKPVSYLVESNPVYDDSGLLTQQQVEELISKFGEHKEIRDFVIVLIKCKLQVNLNCFIPMLKSILQEPIEEREESIIEYYFQNGGVLPVVDHCYDQKKITSLVKKYGVRGDSQVLMNQALQAVNEKMGEIVVLLIHQWIENGGTGNVDLFVSKALEMIDYSPRELAASILELIISSQMNKNITITYSTLFTPEVYNKLEKFSNIETVVTMVNVIQKITQGTFRMRFKVREDYTSHELSDEELLVVLKSQKEMRWYLWSRKERVMNYLEINEKMKDNEIEIAYYIMKVINDTIKRNYEMWKENYQEIIRKIISNCLVINKLNHQITSQNDIVKTIGFVDVVFEGFKMILVLQQITNSSVINPTQAEFIIKTIEKSWSKEMKNYIITMKLIGLKIVQNTSGETEKVKEIGKKIQEEFNINELQESGLSASLIKSIIE